MDDWMPNTNPNLFSPWDSGPILGAHMGVYQGKGIIDLALERGWDKGIYQEEDFEVHSEHFHETTEAAEQYLCTLAPSGYYFGTTDALDWGLWPTEGED